MICSLGHLDTLATLILNNQLFSSNRFNRNGWILKLETASLRKDLEIRDMVKIKNHHTEAQAIRKSRRT